MISAIILFVIWVIVFGILFWIADYAASKFLPAELKDKAHAILVILFALMVLLLILSLVGAVPLAFPGIHPYHY